MATSKRFAYVFCGSIFFLFPISLYADTSYQRQQEAANDAFSSFEREMGLEQSPPPSGKKEPPKAIVIIKERIVEREVPIAVQAPEPVSMPAPTFAPTVAAPSKKASSWPPESNYGYTFMLSGCDKKHTTVICKFTVTREDSDKSLRLYGKEYWGTSSFFDTQGNQYSPSMVSLGNTSNHERTDLRIIQGITTKGELKFSNIAKDLVGISLLEIALHGDKNFNVQFRNIPL